MTTRFLGGTASPLGWTVQYVQADHSRVLDALIAWRHGLGHQLEVSGPLPMADAVAAFLPFQWPWTRELLMPCGNWTAYLNNQIDGGDPSASISVIADQLKVRWVMGMNTLLFGPGHQSTQLEVCGPAGEPPLMYERTLAAHAEDGRWTWRKSGTPFPFEDLARYRAWRKRDRLDRNLLLQYLTALGIPADDDTAYGDGVVVQQRADWHLERPPRTQTLEEAQAELADNTSMRLTGIDRTPP